MLFVDALETGKTVENCEMTLSVELVVSCMFEGTYVLVTSGDVTK